MKAAWYERSGAAREVLQVGDVPDPHAGPGEVRVRIMASGINPSDVKRRAAITGPPVTQRVIPNSDGAGVIDEVGPGVSTRRVGERVYTYNAQWQRPMGTSAQYCVLPAHLVAPLHDEDFAAGACLGIPAMTAHQAVFSGGDVHGLTILVTGGAGAVGHYAVQWAHLGGARVIATASTPAKAALATQAGAETVINYRTEDVAARVLELTGGAGVDRVVEVDFTAHVGINLKVVKPNGVIASYASSTRECTLPWNQLMVRGIEIDGVYVYTMKPAERNRALADLDVMLRKRRLQHQIAARFALEDIVAAHELQESGKATGNIILEPNRD
jgi:NADPH2:quinone reductase